LNIPHPNHFAQVGLTELGLSLAQSRCYHADPILNSCSSHKFPCCRYEGNVGAFRCLAEGRGDVAFLDHHTPLTYTNLDRFEFWSRNLRPTDFRLVCKQGGQAFLADYERCHMAKVPSHFIAMAQSAPYQDYLDAVHVLTSAADKLKAKVIWGHEFKPNVLTSKYHLQDDSSGGQPFLLFGRYTNKSDLLFGDATTGIVALESDANYEEKLGEFLPLIYDTNQYTCENWGNVVRPSAPLIYLIHFLTALLSIKYIF